MLFYIFKILILINMSARKSKLVSIITEKNDVEPLQRNLAKMKYGTIFKAGKVLQK